MKNNRFLFLSLIVSGSLFSSSAMCQSEPKAVPAKPGELKGINYLDVNAWGINGIRYNCDRDFTQECKYIDAMVLALIAHQNQQRSIIASEKSLSYAKDPQAQQLVKIIVDKKKAAYPNYDKKFLDTLSQEQHEKLFQAQLEEIEKTELSCQGYAAQKMYDFFNEKNSAKN